MLYQIIIASYFCTYLVDGNDHQQSLNGSLEISSDWSDKINENELANLLAIAVLRFETEVRGAKLIAVPTNMTTWDASCGSLFFEKNKLTCTVSINRLSLYIFGNLKTIPILQEMYDNNSRIIINAKKVAQIEINSKGYPGTFNMVNGDVGIDDHNPPEMSRAAKKITQWINVKTPERFQHPLLRELENTPGYSVALRFNDKGRLKFKIKKQDLQQLILSVGMTFKVNHEHASIVAVSSKRTLWNATCAPLQTKLNSIQCALSIANLKLYVFKYAGETDFIKEMFDNGRELTVTALQTALVRVNANGQLRIEDHNLRAFNFPSDYDRKLISPFMQWLNNAIRQKKA